MLRLRRYRVFAICAAVFLFLLYRVSQNADWDSAFDDQYSAVSRSGSSSGSSSGSASEPITYNAPPDVEEGDKVRIPKLKTSTEEKNGFALPTPDGLAAAGQPAPTRPPSARPMPDRRPGNVGDVYAHELEEPLHIQKPPGRQQDTSMPTTSTVHWSKQPEWFPVATESLITVPTGKPKAVPRIQASFGSEDGEAKQTREHRLAQVKAEMHRSWDAYRKYAFGHDELKPISKTFDDPFCGWAATLVDTLDSLWIMGMKEEFDDAYKALEDIDFTTTPYRNNIPVFETVIRYLGGLLAAYDVTGGHKGEYPLLLKKAVELSEVLMGVFDTPNRMPDLYYHWKPASASQPRRASNRAGIAELGSLSMEFTRLAQLTGKDKYYDAIARITNALEEWQNRGDNTAPEIPGIFPQNVDATGCNRSATDALREASELAQKQAEAAVLGEPQGYMPPSNSGSTTAALRGKPDVPQGKTDPEFQARRGAAEGSPETGKFKRAEKRQSEAGPAHERFVDRISRGQGQESAEPLGADGLPANWDCVPQNLTASLGTQSYSMGGSQDSAYEYFPKQYLLLGGLEPKYRDLHENTVNAVKKYLLFRPMVPGDPEILFSAAAKVGTNQNIDLVDRITFEYEVTHLTCFIGGMFGLGGKIFDSPADVEIAKRLTDGCVWAYGATRTGIMPEYSKITPCSDIDNCHWNETEWYDALDPDSLRRELDMEDYSDRLEQWQDEVQRALRAEAVRQLAEEEMAQRANLGAAQPKTEQTEQTEQTVAKPGSPVGYSGTKPGSTTSTGSSEDGSPRRDDDVELRSTRSKRGLGSDEILPKKGATEADGLPLDPAMEKAIEERLRKLKEELTLNDLTTGRPAPTTGSFGGTVGQVPIEKANFYLPPRPVKPQTHMEYVKDRIEFNQLPPGFTALGDGRYILRPEAIESVWYMYRITGDPTWQEKGWKMWQAIVEHTRTDIANSAIRGVNGPEAPILEDKMESFWLAETLKYFYLLYAEPDVISLDEWVLNTEAHPFRRPT